MLIRYNIKFDNKAVSKNLIRLINQIYRLLPVREENGDWQKPLDTIIQEFCGLCSILYDYQEKLFQILCKLEGLKVLVEAEDFNQYRRTIFECLTLLNEVEEYVSDR